MTIFIVELKKSSQTIVTLGNIIYLKKVYIHLAGLKSAVDMQLVTNVVRSRQHALIKVKTSSSQRRYDFFFSIMRRSDIITQKNIQLSLRELLHFRDECLE